MHLPRRTGDADLATVSRCTCGSHLSPSESATRLDNRYDATRETQAPIPVGGSFIYRVRFPDAGECIIFRRFQRGF
jgi:hypothetical protein